MGIWYCCVPIAQRRRMKELDRCYKEIVNDNISKEKLLKQSNLNHKNESDFIV